MKKTVLFFLLFIFSSLQSFAESALPLKKTVCLNMIVKDESPVIKRCLESIKPLIDYWVIVDTGSTDGTQEIIKDFMKDIPGEFYERPWVDFAHNRNEALDLARAKADYCLIIDADEQLIFAKDFIMPDLSKDYYSIPIKDLDDSTFQRIHLVSNKLNWHWYGVLHEGIACLEAKSYEVMQGVCNLATTRDGHRSQDPEKHRKDALTLENALKVEPNNSRYVFYLAQTYLNCKDYEGAIKNYEKRVLMGDSKEEVFYSLYMVGKIKQFIGKSFEELVNSYTAAFLARPTRAEPLYQLGCLFLKNEQVLQAYALLKLAATMPIPEDLLFVERSVYEYDALFESANCAALMGNNQEAFKTYNQLVSMSNLPVKLLNVINNNISFVSKSN